MNVSILNLKPEEFGTIEVTGRFQNVEGEVDDLLERLVVDVEERIGAIAHGLGLPDLAAVARAASGLSRIATTAGLGLLARVATDVVICCKRADVMALAAVAERLMRVAEASLAAAIDGACLEC